MTAPRRTITHRMLAVLVLAGLVLAIVGVATRTNDVGAQTDSGPRDGTVAVAGANGLAPIERVVALFERKSAASSLDYLHRTRLGFALLTQAQENADLVTYERAEATFGEALALNPNHHDARLGRGLALAAQHRFADALAIGEFLQQVEPGAAADLLVADAAFELDDVERARTIWTDLAENDRSAVTVSRLARLAAADGHGERAAELAREARQLAAPLPQRPNAAAFYDFQVAHFAWQLDDADAALEALDRALDLDPEHLGSIELAAEVRRERGELVEAADLYAQLLELSPAADLHGFYAEVQLGLGNTALAEAHEAIGMEMALADFERFPAERDHILGFLETRDPALAAELAARS